MNRSTHEAGGPVPPRRRTVLKSLGAAGVAAAATPLLPLSTAHAEGTGAAPAIDWNGPSTVSKTTPTLQVVVNPKIRRESPIHDAVYSALRNLDTDYIRFVPWFPYPKLGVAELEAPADGRTSWDFSLIDPLVEDFEKATRGRSTILNFSTTPEWMWQPAPWTIQDGALRVYGGDNGIAASGTDWTDYTLAVDVTPLGTGAQDGASYAQAGWMVRMQDAGNGYAFLLSNYPYTSPAATGYLTFVRFQNGGVASVQPTALPFAVEAGTTYQVRTTVAGADLTVSVDGTDVLTVHDTTFAAGTVGFRENGSESATFDNVQVTAAGGQTLLADDFSGDLSRWAAPVAYPDDPDAPAFGYSQGQRLAVPVSVVADYYRRLVSWYTAGGFTDEYGTFHRSPHHYELPYWEVLNEVDFEHALSPQEYTELYDAIVTAIREVSPRTKFVGLALGNSAGFDYYRYFLDRANHQPGVPLDFISYHFYAQPNPADTADDYGPDGFAQADGFLSTVQQVEAIRKQLAPDVRTTVDELGSILPGSATQADPAPIPDAYWNFSGGIYAYVFARLALMGIDVVGESQLMGYPSQYPSVSMLDWNTGAPNARYRVLELILDEIRTGSRLIEVAGQPASGAYVLALDDRGRRKVLLINRTNAPVTVDIPGLRGAHLRIVDQQSGGGEIRGEWNHADTCTLGGYAVVVATFVE
ncbi:Glycosyl hydrolases family 39 [Actinacidiphila yanglinensis]|uniref:Glycosyl hydrolases family 39 n=1 Tax=Actinacidiphila yanglinensis TaxID=310779 RepID=A0A1H5W3Q7_9ACTN|nr:family 16 glycoside hydrolase [Actinacidiphila yanglinensis]SEF94070.1 Glycosyl hydrolases family 39 [Actinacidiphila yanglinensis]